MRAANVFSRFASIYGNRWTASYAGNAGEAALAEWGNALQGTTHADIDQAILRCIRRADGWPPTLPEFLTMCRGESEPTRNVPKTTKWTGDMYKPCPHDPYKLGRHQWAPRRAPRQTDKGGMIDAIFGYGCIACGAQVRVEEEAA